jgi:hypothetical protein
MFPFRDASPATHDKQQKTTQATFIALQTESPLAALNINQFLRFTTCIKISFTQKTPKISLYNPIFTRRVHTFSGF